MAIHQTEIHHQEVVFSAPNLQGLRVAWGGIWSGLLFALGVFILLSVLGMAIGVSTVEVGPGGDTSAKTVGIGAGVWGAVTLLIALFVGGWATTRAGMIRDGTTGMIEGVLLWVLSILALLYMASSGIGMLANGVFGSLTAVAQSAGAVVRKVDVDSLASGDPTQISARLKDAKTVSAVAAATGMPEEEARTKLNDLASKVDAAASDPARATAEVRQGLQELSSRAASRAEQAAARAQPYASATLWTTLVSMLLGLAAAIAGAMLGRRQVAERLLRSDVNTAVRAQP